MSALIGLVERGAAPSGRAARGACVPRGDAA